MSRRLSFHPHRVVIPVCIAAAGLLMLLVAHDGGRLRPFDEGVLLALREPADRADPIGPFWLEIFFRDVTALGSHAVLTLLVLAAAIYLRLLRQHASVLLLALSVLGGTALSAGLKLVFDRPRPDLVAHLADIHTASFPSGHAMLSAVAYLTLAGLVARVQPRPALARFVLGSGIALTGLVGISRVYLGVHWPSDVLAGWCLGAAWALISRILVERWDRRRLALRTDG
ncbi:phosphatase PAP2 family protein [Allostella sp. ATCC 35155]|nr:phosphatase PAP2 family protein [Stella sp. ATCC 35155]